MASAVEELLSAWRDGERLLDELPPLHPDRETVVRTVGELRTLYARMTDVSDLSQAKLATAHRVVEASHAAIRRVRERLEGPDPASPRLDRIGDPG